MPGRPGIPSVTEVIELCGLGFAGRIPPAKREWAFARGRALHAAIELDAVGDLDEASVHPDIAGQLDAYRKWVAHSRHTATHSEIELTHSRWGFMGHPDRVGYITTPQGRRRVLVDWKHSFDRDSCRLQLAGYALLYRDAYPDEPIDEYLALELRPDGTFMPHPLDAEADEQLFLACLVVARALVARRRAPLTLTEDVA